MMRNSEVIQCFLNQEAANGSNLYSTGDKLVSYSTTIAQWKVGRLILNTTYYSRSTSKWQNQIIPPKYIEPIIIDNVPRGTQDLLP